MLIIFSGLSGSGKTTIARELALQIGAVYLRIDSIEQALRESSAAIQPLNDAGYRVGYAIAEDNLRLGRSVIADSVNPIRLTREAWREVAKRSQVGALEIEVMCSDPSVHRRRVEGRVADISGLQLPDWEQVISREYHPWDRNHLVIDTAVLGIDESVSMIRERARRKPPGGWIGPSVILITPLSDPLCLPYPVHRRKWTSYERKTDRTRDLG